MPFENVKLNDGNEMPAIAFGTGTVRKGHDATEMTGYVAQALESGFSHISTAQSFRNEENVGTAVRESGLSRSELFITTQYFSDPIQESVRSSLAKLGLKYVDLYLIQHPTCVAPDFVGAWKELEKIKEDGLARSIGVSNYNLEQLEALVKISRIPPAVNQISFHPYNYAENKALLEYSAQQGIVIETYSSHHPLTKYSGGPVDAPVNAAAKRRGVTPNQIIMAWVRAKGATIVASASLNLKERLDEYIAVSDIDPLTEDEITAIDVAGVKASEKTEWPTRKQWIRAIVNLLILYGLFKLIDTMFK